MQRSISPLRIRKRFTKHQRDLVLAITEVFGLAPACFVTDAYLRAVHAEYFQKQAEDAIFNLLLDEKREHLQQFMDKYASNRKKVARMRVTSDNVELTLFD